MKIMAYATALLMSSFFIVPGEAFLFDCKIDATFDVYDDPNDPMLPSTSEKLWAASAVMTSYNSVHHANNDDFDMDNVSLDSFSWGDDGSSEETGSIALRGGKNVNNIRRMFQKYKHHGRVTCYLCKDWDDDDAMNVRINADDSVNHERWVQAWCDELNHGPYMVFMYAENCKIQLYDCNTFEEGEEADVDVDTSAKEVDKLEEHVGAVVVGSGIETIKAEALVEAQEMNEE